MSTPTPIHATSTLSYPLPQEPTHHPCPCITSIKWWFCDIAIPIHAKSSVVLSRACITLVRTLMLIIIAHSPSTNGSISYFVDGLMFSRCVISLLVTVRVLLTSSVFLFIFTNPYLACRPVLTTPFKPYSTCILLLPCFY